MPYIPELLRRDALTEELYQSMTFISQGKVRDTFRPLQKNGREKLLLMVASNRISTYDFVLGSSIPFKGATLTAINVFWRTFLRDACRHDLIACGTQVDDYVPTIPRNLDELHTRSIIVRGLTIIPVECVVRAYLSGSAFKEYREKKGVVCGRQLPEGLHDGSKLPHPIFTPTTKASAGHDKPLSCAYVANEYGKQLENLSLMIFEIASAHLAAKDIILADTKFEWGVDASGAMVLADEVITPDSSRLWLTSAWEEAQGKAEPCSPRGFDKQSVRNFTAAVKTPFLRHEKAIVGIGGLNPSKVRHRYFAGEIKLPPEIIRATTEDYLRACELITGKPLDRPRP